MKNTVCPPHFCGLGMTTLLLNYIDTVKIFQLLLVSGVYNSTERMELPPSKQPQRACVRYCASPHEEMIVEVL